MADEIAELKEMIQNSQRIVFFGGAGVSTESQIPDFRSADGLYQDEQSTQYTFPPEAMLSHTFFMRHTEEFFRFYFDRMVYPGAEPNPAHYALAKLEQQGKLTAVITQNIDGLHQKAGSRQVLELHGSVLRNACMECKARYGLDYMLERKGEGIPLCEKCGGVVKPHVVLYEESLEQKILEEAVNHIRRADLLIVGGTSLSVYPAAGLINYYRGHNLVLINQSITKYDRTAAFVIREKIGTVLDACVLDSK